MQWHRIRQAETKHAITMAQFDLSSMIRARMEREAMQQGFNPARNRFVFMRRDNDPYIEFNLDIDPPNFIVKKLHMRGWEVWNDAEL